MQTAISFACFTTTLRLRDDNWLDEMLSRIMEDNVGAVGALLLWPSGVVQHGGFVLGSSLESSMAALRVADAFNDRMDDDPGYCDLLQVAHECSAVTAACMLTRRSDYIDVGGMDEMRFPVHFNDVDYCLKLRALGRRIVFTPHARLVHHRSAVAGRSGRRIARRSSSANCRTCVQNGGTSGSRSLL